MTNTNNTQKANEIKVNGNCKGVRDITNDIHYDSVKDAAKANGVANSTMSVAINRGYTCNGNQFVFEKDLHKSGDKLCAENAKANARVFKEKTRADKAEAKLSEMETEMAEFRQWKADQEAKRKAEEKARKEEEARLERERKEEEKRQKMIAKAQEKVDRWEKKLRSHNALGKDLEQKLMKAEIELEALMDNGKEVA